MGRKHIYIDAHRERQKERDKRKRTMKTNEQCSVFDERVSDNIVSLVDANNKVRDFRKKLRLSFESYLYCGLDDQL